MTSTPPKPPAASFLSGSPRGDVTPRRMLDTPALGGGLSGSGMGGGNTMGGGIGGGLSGSMPGGGLGAGRPGVPAPQPVADSAPETVSDAGPQRRLTVGRDISLCGEIASCEILVVEGTVEAKLRDGRSIEVTETGLFKGSVEIDEADIGGTFNGDIVVRNRLRVRATGRITGSIVYGELEVENGGQLSGSINRYDPTAKLVVPPTATESADTV